MEQSTASSGGADRSDKHQTGQDVRLQGLARIYGQKLGQSEQKLRKKPENSCFCRKFELGVPPR